MVAVSWAHLIPRFNIISSTFTKNSVAHGGGGVAYADASSFNIVDSVFYANKASRFGGIIFTTECSIRITNGSFGHNLGSLYVFNSNLTFNGYVIFENCHEPSDKTVTTMEISSAIVVELSHPHPEGGAITSIQSTVIFTGVINLSNNQARRGGAILAAESKLSCMVK